MAGIRVHKSLLRSFSKDKLGSRKRGGISDAEERQVRQIIPPLDADRLTDPNEGDSGLLGQLMKGELHQLPKTLPQSASLQVLLVLQQVQTL